MKVILLEKVKGLGDLGAEVLVKAGFGRNFLIPQKKAVFATPGNIARFEQHRAELEKKAQQSLAQAQQKAAKINDISIVISALSSDEGKLFGSVSAGEIQEALAAKSIEVNKREIILTEGPIHSTGDFVVEVHLHTDVIAKLQVQVISAKRSV